MSKTRIEMCPDFSVGLYAGLVGGLDWIVQANGYANGERQFTVTVYGVVSKPVEIIQGEPTLADLEVIVRRLYAEAQGDVDAVLATPDEELRRLGLLTGKAAS